jgi:peptidoglycan/LPS O-acetylase OafA/YrhL
MQNKRLKIILLIISLMLLTPIIAMQFTSEVDWKPFDFIVAGVLLFGTGLLCELVLRKVKKTSHRIIICAALLILLLLIWIELAVGLFGTPFGGN